MNKILKAAVVVLILASVIQAGAMGYMFGYEQGVSSQEITILQPNVWFHPLRDILFSTSSILMLCWAITIALILRRGPSEAK